MYTGNGVTKEFPLPEGWDGVTVVWISPYGRVTKVKEGEVYTVREDGKSVIFSLPPPEGWRVAFDENAANPPPPPAVPEDWGDPRELLAKAKTEREETKRLLTEARREMETALSRILAAAAEAKETLKSRLLNYDARAEAAIAAAVRATGDETASVINRNLLEIRNKHRQAVSAQISAEGFALRAEKASEKAAETVELIHDARKTFDGEKNAAWKNMAEQAEKLRNDIQKTISAALLEIRSEKEEAGFFINRQIELGKEEVMEMMAAFRARNLMTEFGDIVRKKREAE